MKVLFYVFGVLAVIATLLLFAAADSAIHEGVAAIVGLTAVISIGIGAVLSKIEEHAEAVRKADIHAWNIGLAQWEELKQPGGVYPYPDSDYAAYRDYRPAPSQNVDLKA